MGGFAEDALLFHQIMGPHADLNVLVVRQQFNRRCQQLQTLGLAEPTAPLEEAPRYPVTLTTHPDGPQIEIWVCTPELNGGYSFDVADPSLFDQFRIFLPSDTFQYPATMLERVTIQTILPLVAMIRAGFRSAKSRKQTMSVLGDC